MPYKVINWLFYLILLIKKTHRNYDILIREEIQFFILCKNKLCFKKIQFIKNTYIAVNISCDMPPYFTYWMVLKRHFTKTSASLMSYNVTNSLFYVVLLIKTRNNYVMLWTYKKYDPIFSVLWEQVMFKYVKIYIHIYTMTGSRTQTFQNMKELTFRASRQIKKIVAVGMREIFYHAKWSTP